MAVLEIIQPDNPILRKKAVRVTSFDKKFQQLVDDMIDTMLDAPGVGLAAPQVAVSQRVIVVRLPDDEASREEYGKDAGVLYVVANPKIIKHSRNTVEGIEACLSIPGYYGEVDRYESVVITGQDRHGSDIRIKAKGWLARVFQHELDHLDGQLFIDIASSIWRASDEAVTEGEVPEVEPEGAAPETGTEAE
ncbi:MAG: peptide deformylase [Chloroflexota bacterium]